MISKSFVRMVGEFLVCCIPNPDAVSPPAHRWLRGMLSAVHGVGQENDFTRQRLIKNNYAIRQKNTPGAGFFVCSAAVQHINSLRCPENITVR